MAINQNLLLGTVVNISVNDNQNNKNTGIITEIRNEGQSQPYGIEIDGQMQFFEEKHLIAA